MAAYGLFNGRLPFSSRFASNRDDGDDGQTKAIYGDSSVRFKPDGRPSVPGMERPRSNLLFWRGGGGGNGEPPPDAGNWRYRPWNREVVGAHPPPIITRRADFAAPPELPYSGRAYFSPEPVATRTTRQVTTTMKPETIVVEEMKIYDDRPCVWWLFIVIGLVMLILGVLNLLFCWEIHYGARFWTGVLLIIFGIVGAFHKGEYVVHKWKSILYIVLGFIVTGAVLGSCYLLAQQVAHRLIEISQFGASEYIEIQKFRYAFEDNSPRVNLTNWDTNIWVCFGLDSFFLLLLVVSFLALASALMVLDRYYNSHYVISRKVEPFCEPWLFNPWGQCQLGQIQIFLGFVMAHSVHGFYKQKWHETYAPVWAGIFPIFAGVAAALTLKSCYRKWNWLNILAIILEILSILASLAAIGLVSYGLYENIRTLGRGDYMVVTDWPKRMIVASSVLQAISDITCIINVFWSISLLFRIFTCLFSKKKETEMLVEETRYLDDGREEVVEDMTYGPEYVRRTDFDDYRPAGARSYYVR